MPRFTLKTLFVSMTLIAASIWLAMRATDRINTLFNPGPAPYMQLVVAGSMFGAGLRREHLVSPYDSGYTHHENATLILLDKISRLLQT